MSLPNFPLIITHLNHFNKWNLPTLNLDKSISPIRGCVKILLTNSAGPNQTAPKEQSDLGLHSLTRHRVLVCLGLIW